MINNEKFVLSLNKLTESIRTSRYYRNEITYNFNNSIQILTAVGKGFCPSFEIDNDYFDIYKNMLMYFMADPEFPGDLNRGLLLKGPVGSGKTLSFLIFHKFLQVTGISRYSSSNIPEPGDCSFTIIRCKDIKGLYEDSEPGKGGDNAIKDFKFNRSIKCFDDLGEELQYGNSIHFGRECNVMEEILTARYELFLRYGTITHCTTNYSFDLEGKRHFNKLYGERVEDRMKEMFNEITFKGESKRARL